MRICDAHLCSQTFLRAKTEYEINFSPVDPQTGAVIDPATGRPYLEQQLVPGFELLRAVCYSLARVDAWCMGVQAAYESRGDGSMGCTARQTALLEEVYAALDGQTQEQWRESPRTLGYSLVNARASRYAHAA